MAKKIGNAGWQSTKSSHRYDVAQCIFCDSYINITGGKLIPLCRGVISGNDVRLAFLQRVALLSLIRACQTLNLVHKPRPWAAS